MPISRENAFVVRGTAFGRKPNVAGLQALSSEGDLVFVEKGYAARRILERALGFLLGHADLKTTHRVYVHTKIADVRRRMEALDGKS